MNFKQNHVSTFNTFFMKNYIFIILLLVAFSSCENKKEVTVKTPKKEKLIMYKPSEMTILMREMFEFQEDSKNKIEKGELPLNFPEKFKTIHSAKLSDQFEHDASFKGFTNLYYQNIKSLDNSTKEDARENFNAAIQTCIACHETTCSGPIPRIKKLLIN